MQDLSFGYWYCW